ncbi:hypothetical protein [Oceanobacillus iheyensis HTE831]|uniref:Uncharacterized protein n=1 Tax=Oceanobacillus iheyensis (strain DSM 14371 / CIP 107618 / JCM 11309 / KCTC 3954 / HTE831) TaxID=221109 RepID=Q8ET52_OCEIH|nr:hypothetical protein [Oceanobacillus iheyensis HTE831]
MLNIKKTSLNSFFDIRFVFLIISCVYFIFNFSVIFMIRIILPVNIILLATLYRLDPSIFSTSNPCLYFHSLFFIFYSVVNIIFNLNIYCYNRIIRINRMVRIF